MISFISIYLIQFLKKLGTLMNLMIIHLQYYDYDHLMTMVYYFIILKNNKIY